MIRKCVVLIISLMLILVAYASADQSVVMEVKGMTCPLCPLAAQKSLSSIEGVKDVEVSFEKEKAWLTVEESITDETLSDAVKKAGFKGTVIERNTKE